MIEINTGDDRVTLGPLGQQHLDTAVELFNSSGEYRYATGNSYPLSHRELAERVKRIESSKGSFLSGIFLDSRLVGVVSGIILESYLWIKLMAVLPAYRRRGIGTEALKLLHRYCSSNFDISEVFLSVAKKNEIGLNFWLKQGYSETGRFTKELFGESQFYEIIIMNKKLTEN